MASTLWDDYQVTPVEVALPGGKVGLTLRAYRPAGELTPTDVSEREDDDDVFAAKDSRRPIPGLADDEDMPEFVWTKEALDEVAAGPAEDEVAERAVEAEEAEEEEEAEAAASDEEVPAFLSHKGRLLLFASAKGLADFVRSNAPHDLKQLEGWSKFAKSVKADDVVAGEDDAYELDLVVENLRGGPDAWDPDLLLRAGEFARDVSYALRLKPVMVALSPGSPLDDLDEALRASADGGLGGFFAKRKLRKIGAEQASIGWRSIIGKISGAVDWRD